MPARIKLTNRHALQHAIFQVTGNGGIFVNLAEYNGCATYRVTSDGNVLAEGGTLREVVRNLPEHANFRQAVEDLVED